MATFREIRTGIATAGIYDILKFIFFGGVIPVSTVTAAFWIAWDWIVSLHPLYIVTAGLVCAVSLEWALLGWLKWRRGRSVVETSAGTQSAVQRGQPYNEAWSDANMWSLWQVACLWEGEEPHLPIVHGTKPYPRLKILEGDIKIGFLEVYEKEEKEMAWWIVSMPDLVDYCDRQGYDPLPKFLFSNN